MLKSVVEKHIESLYNINVVFDNFKIISLKRLSIGNLLIDSKKYKAEAEDINFKVKSFSLMQKKAFIKCSADKLNFHNKTGIFSLLDLLKLKSSDFARLDKIVYNRVSLDVVTDKDQISLQDIKAEGKLSKVTGNIKITNDATSYDLQVYVLTETAEDMPEISKKLLNLETDKMWSRFNIDITIPKRR
jgi:hypothetical protein